MKLLFLSIAVFSVFVLQAQVLYSDYGQNETGAGLKLGKLNISQDSRLEQMVARHIEKNKDQSSIKGYRIDIFSGSDSNAKERALSKKAEFLALYPDLDVHVTFISPNFKVRVGDFRTKSEAFKVYKQIQGNFPGAFIVDDDIDFPVLKPM